MKSRTIYLLLALGFTVSFAVAALQPVGDLARAIAAVPAAAAMVAAMFQLVRDQVAHDRAVSLQYAQNSFAMGATSHMANVASTSTSSFAKRMLRRCFRPSTRSFAKAPQTRFSRTQRLSIEFARDRRFG